MPPSPKSNTFQNAVDAHKSGRFADAAAGYEALLASAPGDAQLRYLLGSAYVELNRFDEAAQALEQALDLHPGHLPTLEMLGTAFARAGAYDKAAAPFREAERLSGTPESTLRLANILRLAGNHGEACAAYRRVLARDASHRQGRVGLAMCLAACGDLETAHRELTECLRQHPDYAAAATTLASLLGQAERFADAENVLRDFLAGTPTHVEARKLLANTLHKQGRFPEAETLYRAVLREAPGDVLLSLQLAEGLLDVPRTDEAEAILVPLRRSAPGNAGVITALGRVLEQRGALDEAIALHTQAIAADPQNENAYVNRGTARRFAGDYEGALADYNAALALKPDFPPAIASRALTLLILGRLREAWPDYRARIKAQPGAVDLSGGQPWDGGPLHGKRVLVWLEYGLGDEIMFASLLPELIETAAHCTIVCAPRLRTLFARSFPRAAVIGRGDPIAGTFDIRLPLTDVAQLLRPDLASFPRHNGYLAINDALAGELRRRYAAQGSERLVGLSWRSASGPSGRFKSTDLAQWRDILRVPGVTFVSLQYGDCADDVARASAMAGRPVIHDRTVDSSGDLDAFAAQVAAMDLVISVSNTTVHVAGALARPVWTIVPSGPGGHWYWFLNRSDNPWYPTARVFRQDQRGDWQKPLRDVASALETWARP